MAFGIAGEHIFEGVGLKQGSWITIFGFRSHPNFTRKVSIMRKLWSFVVLAAFCVVASTSFAQDSASSGSLNQLSESEKGDGWKLLFDGKTTTAGAITKRKG